MKIKYGGLNMRGEVTEINADDAKVVKISEFPRPKDNKSVQEFTGLIKVLSFWSCKQSSKRTEHRSLTYKISTMTGWKSTRWSLMLSRKKSRI